MLWGILLNLIIILTLKCTNSPKFIKYFSVVYKYTFINGQNNQVCFYYVLHAYKSYSVFFMIHKLIYQLFSGGIYGKKDFTKMLFFTY